MEKNPIKKFLKYIFGKCYNRHNHQANAREMNIPDHNALLDMKKQLMDKKIKDINQYLGSYIVLKINSQSIFLVERIRKQIIYPKLINCIDQYNDFVINQGLISKTQFDWEILQMVLNNLVSKGYRTGIEYRISKFITGQKIKSIFIEAPYNESWFSQITDFIKKLPIDPNQLCYFELFLVIFL